MGANKLFHDDLEYVSAAEFIPWEKLKHKTVFMTGATGLIGYTLVNSLMYANKKHALNLKVLALVRDLDRAKERFSEYDNDNALEYIHGNVELLPEIEEKIDYIIHGANQTASKAFVNEPVETILTALKGTENVLELAKAKKVSGIVYLSSMEVYGHPKKGHEVSEYEIGTLSPLEIRNSYPLSKIQCENLCFAYAKEYSVPAMVVRLTQTFGPGVNYYDGRVFAEFARCVIEKRDIVLKTKGDTERCYLYTADAATAILTALLKGEPGEAYNAANEDTYCSIAQMAELVAKQNGIKVRIETENIQNTGYASTLFMKLNTDKLRKLSWLPKYQLPEMYEKMIVQITKL